MTTDLSCYIEPFNGICCSCGASAAADEACHNRTDGTHCVHWWDGPDTDEEENA